MLNHDRRYPTESEPSEQQFSQILQQFMNSHEWQPIPEIIFLTIKAMTQYLNYHDEKFTQFRIFMNDISLKTKQLDVNMMQKISKKDNNREIQNIVKNLLDNHNYSLWNSNQEGFKSKQCGLDSIMIQEVTSIAQKCTDLQFQKYQQNALKIQRKFQQQYQFLNSQMQLIQHKYQSLKNQISILKKVNDQNTNNFYQTQLQIQKLQGNFTSKTNDLLDFMKQHAIEKLYRSNSHQYQSRRHTTRQFSNNKQQFEQFKHVIHEQLKAIKKKLQKPKKGDENPDFLEFKRKISKELLETVKIQEIQSIITSIQNQMLEKFHKIEKNIKKAEKSILATNTATRQEIHENQLTKHDKNSRINKKTEISEKQSILHHKHSVKQIQLSLSRVQRAIENREVVTRDVLEESIKHSILAFKKGLQDQLLQRQRRIFELFDKKQHKNINRDSRSHLQSIEPEKYGIIQIKKAILELSKNFLISRYLYFGGHETKGDIVWEEETANNMKDNYIWKHGKANIHIQSSGLYKVQGGLYGGQNVQAYLIINGEPISKFRATDLPATSEKKFRGYLFCQAILLSTMSELSIKVEKKFYGQAYLQIQKL